MNDPDRWSTSHGFDDDAIFADIVAHLNDDAGEIQRPTRPPPGKAATREDPTVDPSDKEPTVDTTDHEARGGTSGQDDQWPWNEPTVGATDQGPTADATDQGPTAGATDQGPTAATDHQARDATSGQDDHWSLSEPAGPSMPGDPQVIPPNVPSQVWRAHEADDTFEEHFEPPPVAPLPVGDLQFWAIIAGMGGGPLLLLYLVFFSRDASTYWTLAAIAMSVGGFALLVSRLPGNHEDDDDGARL